MPHQCVRCNMFYEDGAQELLKGCPCGARLFFFVRKEKLEAAKNVVLPELNSQQKQQIEHDVLELLGDREDDTPVVLDIENIRVLAPGKYELDIVRLFQKQPLVFKIDDGKYVIDITQGFDQLKKKPK